jgi:hypothetical protein
MADDKEKRPTAGPPSGGPDRAPQPAPSPEEPAATTTTTTKTERPLNETVPGGRYIVGEQTVDAEGRPLTE